MIVKTKLIAAISLIGLGASSMAEPNVRFHISVHSETSGGGSNGIPFTPNFTTANEATYLVWREAIITFAGLCSARGLPWQFQPDWNFLEGVRRFEVLGGSGYDPAILNGTRIVTNSPLTLTTNTGGKNVIKYLHENLGVNIDPHSHETGGYNYADVAWLIDVGCDTDVTGVVGGHVYTGTGYQQWPRFVEDIDGNGLLDGLLSSKHAGYHWKPVLLMGAGTAAHSNDPHVSGLWHPSWTAGSTNSSATQYFTDSPGGPIAAIGNWEQDLAQGDRFLSQLESGAVPDAGRLWTMGHVFNHRDMVLAGYLSSIMPAQLDTLRRWQDAGRVTVSTFTNTYSVWQSAPNNNTSTLYQRPVDNLGFSLNWQDFSYPADSIAELRILLNAHEQSHVPVDVFLTTWQTDIIESGAPDLLGRLRSSAWVNMGYHVRAPKPYAENYNWWTSRGRTLTSTDLTNYESRSLDMATGESIPNTTGGFGKLSTLLEYAPLVVGASNSDATLRNLIRNYFGGAGARMMVEHRDGVAVNYGEQTGSLFLRPENYDWRLIETFNGTGTVSSIPDALSAARSTTNSLAPYFVGVKLHDNDLFSTQSAWTWVYQNGRIVPNWSPYATAAPALDSATRTSRRSFYTSLLTSAATTSATTLNLVNSRDTLGLLGQDVARPLGLSMTEVNEAQPVNTVLAILSGGGISSGVGCDYALVSGEGSSDNSDFSIAGNELRAARSLDQETAAVKHLRVRWSDGGGNSGERALTIMLSNVTTDDDDADGATEAEETLAGTDPRSANSRLRVQSTEMDGGRISMTWASVGGKTYKLQQSTDLITWTDMSGTQVTATGTTTSCSVPHNGAPQMFFRVAVVSP